MEELDEEARVLDGESTHSEPPFGLGSTNPVPSDEALSTIGPFTGVPKEGTAQGVEGLDHGGGEAHVLRCTCRA
jgi:hypothetical protein